VLPALLAGDPDRLARFQREAEVLASLSHPNIGGIHGLEESGGVTALVLELVEGPTGRSGCATPRHNAIFLAPASLCPQ
jgi:eukaryotic-like serine/threonine-protein kinase